MTSENDLFGVWRLKSFIVTRGESVKPWGSNMVGILIYTSDHFMSVSINKNCGQSMFNAESDSLFYAGRFSLSGSQITHKVEVSTNGERIGSQLIRTAELFENQLSLIGTNDAGAIFTLAWTKV